MDATTKRVLLVESSSRTRDRIGGWLESAGYGVLGCPGPSAPSYRCVGSDTVGCPLMDGADAVVLDLHLASDTVGEGTPAWELLLLYEGSGKPVVVLTDHEDPVVPTADAATAVIDRHPTRDALLEALDPLLAARPIRRT